MGVVTSSSRQPYHQNLTSPASRVYPTCRTTRSFPTRIWWCWLFWLFLLPFFVLMKVCVNKHTRKSEWLVRYTLWRRTYEHWLGYDHWLETLYHRKGVTPREPYKEDSVIQFTSLCTGRIPENEHWTPWSRKPVDLLFEWGGERCVNCLENHWSFDDLKGSMEISVWIIWLKAWDVEKCTRSQSFALLIFE
jgi:hypothetical protein